MLKKLRIRFVVVIMVIVTVMLCSIFGMIYYFTAENMENGSINMMQSIAADPFQLGRPDDSSGDLRLPYFMLQIGNHGELIATRGGYYDLSDEEFLKELIEAVFATREQTGIIEEYNLRFCRVVTPVGQSLVFADITSERSTLQNLAQNCLMIGALCFLVFLGISILLAGWMVRPVDKAWKQQRQFVADASHELKTPLTVIMANAEMLQSPDYDGESKGQFTDNILIMSRQMRKLVERLLDLARADNEQGKMLFQPLELSALTEKVLLPFEPVLFEKGLRLSGEITPGIIVSGSEQHLHQVLDILLDNAQKYSDGPGEIIVRLERAGKRRCRLSVSNPGKEISGEDLKNVFKRFYRVDQARSRDGSFGLGLSIAESIVNEHHGRIWAESREGINTFFVELPIK
ncbi:MAG: sensor histidine kinase [Oscillospiraceae bacterium]